MGTTRLSRRKFISTVAAAQWSRSYCGQGTGCSI
jgi:hypothetical protein